MKYVKELGIYINKVEDLRDKVSEDMYEAIEKLVLNAGEQNDDDYENLKEEFKVYEFELENFRSSFNEILCLVNEFENELCNLYDYVCGTKRINREKILNSISKVDVQLIGNIINRL